MRLVRGIPVAFLAAGVASLVAAVATGEATVYLVLVVPVLAGSSGLLLLGIVLLFLGFFTLPLGFPGESEEGRGGILPEPAPGMPRPATPPAPAGSGGVILLGPVPLFFGSFRNPSPRVYWLAVLVGAVVLAVVLGFFVARAL